MSQYLKAIVPVALGVILLAADKLLAGDSVPDEAWLALMGVAVPVLAVPNRR